MHLSDAFIQSDLQCIQAIRLCCQYVCSLGIEPRIFVLLTQCSTTEPQEHIVVSSASDKSVLKGIVHPKMIILSFTYYQVFPSLYECLCSAEHKGRYSEECEKQSSSGAPLTSMVFCSYYGSQWCPKTIWLQTFFKISSFLFGRTKTFIHV